MKINTRTVFVSFLLIMSLTSYIFLSNIEVSEPTEVTTLEYEEDNKKDAQMILPDITLVQKLVDVISKVMVN